MDQKRLPVVVGSIVLAAIGVMTAARQDRLIHAELAYAAPGTGPAPNFSPYGTQVALTDLAASAPLPPGAARPAKTGMMQIGPTRQSWVPVLATADAAHPADLCRIYLDRNRNGNFADDGPALTATPSQNDKTKAWWSSFSKAELTIPYGKGPQGEVVEPYLVTFWIVRDGEAAPKVLRYSVASWRSGTVRVAGVEALVAVMDANNDAIFDARDMWSVLAASEPDAAKRVLSIAEARDTNRLMFLETGTKEVVLEFRGISPDGRSIDFAVVDRPVTKAADRAPDDTLASERSRPRAKTPFMWGHSHLDAALTEAKATGRDVLVDFEATWCGPCKSMDEWIWNDAEVAALLNAKYVGVKLDGDVEKALVKRFAVAGYPVGIILDSAGKEKRRFEGYQTSKEVLAFLGPRAQPSAQAPAQTETDEYARYELLAPDTASFAIVDEVSATTGGARYYFNAIRKGSDVSHEAVVDMMTGAPLAFQDVAAPQARDAGMPNADLDSRYIQVTLARPVPPGGQGRVRIQKTYQDRKSYYREGDDIVFNRPIGAARNSVILPPGFELVSCNVPSQVLSEDDGRIGIAFMHQAPGDLALIVRARLGAAVGAAAAPTPLTNARSWESPGQGGTERARLAERAHQDRDIVYFLQDPATHAFSLYHDYTESRPGTDTYLNVVRTGSQVSNPSAYILDTGEVLKDEILKGPAVTAARLDIGEPVTPDTEVVVVHFPPVQAGRSVRLRISETYAAPQSYRLEGADLVFERSLGRPRNAIVLPAGWYLTASSIPAVVSETSDKRIRLDFMNGRPDSIDVLVKARRRPAG